MSFTPIPDPNIVAKYTSECPKCGGKEIWTGITGLHVDKTYYQMTCQECVTDSTGWEWHAAWDQPNKNTTV